MLSAAALTFCVTTAKPLKCLTCISLILSVENYQTLTYSVKHHCSTFNFTNNSSKLLTLVKTQFLSLFRLSCLMYWRINHKYKISAWTSSSLRSDRLSAQWFATNREDGFVWGPCESFLSHHILSYVISSYLFITYPNLSCCISEGRFVQRPC